MQAIEEEDGIQKEWYAAVDDVKTVADLTEFVRHLTEDYGHDYGTICHAVAAAALAAAKTVDRSPAGGITGFQAGCIMWEFIRRWMQKEGPLRLVEHRGMLYPRHENEFKSISKETWEWLQKEARESLDGRKNRNPDGSVFSDSTDAHPEVIAHWETIVAGTVPFGYTVKED